MWDVPGPEIKPLSPVLQGGFLTTGPPGKPLEPVLRWPPSSDQSSTAMMPVTILGSSSPCTGRAQTSLLERRKQRGRAPGEGTPERGGLKAGLAASWKMGLSRSALGLSFP